MISYPVYKLVHLIGIMLVFLAMGGLSLAGFCAATKPAAELKKHPWRRPLMITHGVGLLLVLVGGFGLLARLGLGHGAFPNWAAAKVAIWVIVSALIVVLMKRPQLSGAVWWATPVLGGLAAYLALNKPF